MKLNREEAELLAFEWVREQETIYTHDGPGGLYRVRDFIVSFVNGGASQDGPGASVTILPVEVAIQHARAYFEEASRDLEEGETFVGEGRTLSDYVADYGLSGGNMADYLMTATGGPEEYSAE